MYRQGTFVCSGCVNPEDMLCRSASGRYRNGKVASTPLNSFVFQSCHFVLDVYCVLYLARLPCYNVDVRLIISYKGYLLNLKCESNLWRRHSHSQSPHIENFNKRLSFRIYIIYLRAVTSEVQIVFQALKLQPRDLINFSSRCSSDRVLL